MNQATTWTADYSSTVADVTGNGNYYPYFYGTVSGSTYGNGQYVTWANSYHYTLNDLIYKAFDSSSTSHWHTADSTTASYSSVLSTLTFTMGIKLPSAITLCSFSIQARYDCCFWRAGSIYTVLGSNTGTSWTTIATISTSWSYVSEVQTFSAIASANYVYYQLCVYLGSYDSVNIAEIRLYGYPA